MIQLFCAVQGEIEYVADNDDEFKSYIRECHSNWLPSKDSEIYLSNFRNPLNYQYCYPAFRAWQLNKRLKEGKILVGVDGDSYLFAKAEDVVKTETVKEVFMETHKEQAIKLFKRILVAIEGDKARGKRGEILYSLIWDRILDELVEFFQVSASELNTYLDDERRKFSINETHQSTT